VILTNDKGLVNVDLSPAYRAASAGAVKPGQVTMFKKKENISGMARSILKHRIQTLTGKQIKLIEEEMGYKPKDPNELGMDLETMKRLSHFLILLSNGVEFDVPAVANRDPSPPPLASAPSSARKRRPDSQEAPQEMVKKARTSGRRSIATPTRVATPPVRQGRRSIAVSRLVEDVTDMAIDRTMEGGSTSRTPTGARSGRRSAAQSSGSVSTPGRRASSNLSTVSEASQAVRCLGPVSTDNVLDTVQENGEDDLGIENPTPMMVEMLKKRKSLAATGLKKSSPAKVASAPPVPAKVAAAPAVPPRQGFPGPGPSTVFLLAGAPLSLTHQQLARSLPLSARFPGAHLTVVHTPAHWSPHEMFQIAQVVKKINREAGLDTFVFLAGTGINNVHLNMEALLRHTQHVQLVTFHREDANLGMVSGKLRETASYFLVGYFFPGCQGEESQLPDKMVRDGYTTVFRTESAAHLEKSIVDCFSETGEWVLDVFGGARKLSLEASQQGRSAVAVSPETDKLEELGQYLRTAAILADNRFRDEDGLVVQL